MIVVITYTPHGSIISRLRLKQIRLDIFFPRRNKGFVEAILPITLQFVTKKTRYTGVYDCCRRFPNYPGYDWHMYTSFGSSFFPQGKRQCNSISPYFANNLVRYIGQYDCCHNVYAAILNTTLVKNAIGTLESSFSPHEGKAMPYKFLRRSHPGSISPFFVYAANFGSRFAGRTDIFFGIKKKVHWCV